MNSISCSLVRWLALTFLSVALPGCTMNYTVHRPEDVEWRNHRLRAVVNSEHYSEPRYDWDEVGGRMTAQERHLVTVPFPEPTLKPLETRKLGKSKGEEKEKFLLISGSDTMIHRRSSEYRLFDPKTRQDISGPFPPVYRFNRSHTAFLSVIDGQTVIIDTLSVGTGDKVLARPPWTAALNRLKNPRVGRYLTDDLRYLVLLEATTPGIHRSSGAFEVYSADGTVQSGTNTLTMSSEHFVDVESVDGKVLFLTRGLLTANGSQDLVRLINLNGETVCTNRIAAGDQEHAWNLQLGSILFVPEEFSDFGFQEQREKFDLWDYSANTVKRLNVWK